MDRHDIVTLPSEILRQPSQPIKTTADNTEKLINNMESATLDWEDHRQHEVGVALAAIQIGTPKKVIIVRKNFQDKDNREFDVYLNPKITQKSGIMEQEPEGCLSVPDIYGLVPRYQQVQIEAQNRAGETVTIEAEGFLARIFQHEIDHNRGKLFIDYVKDRQFYRLNSEGEFEPIPKSELPDKITNSL